MSGTMIPDFAAWRSQYEMARFIWPADVLLWLWLPDLDESRTRCWLRWLVEDELAAGRAAAVAVARDEWFGKDDA